MQQICVYGMIKHVHATDMCLWDDKTCTCNRYVFMG